MIRAISTEPQEPAMLSLEIIATTASADASSKQPLATAKLFQAKKVLVPRSYLPSVVVLTVPDSRVHDNDLFALVEEALQWYLDRGGRLNKLEVSTSDARLGKTLAAMGFTANSSPTSKDKDRVAVYTAAGLPLDPTPITVDAGKLLTFLQQRLTSVTGQSLARVHDIIGRVLHDQGRPKDAIEAYTQALIVNPSSAAVFRNLGSAYHAVEDMQLAFASYQQAVDLDPTDALVYLKLAFFYEDYAKKDWIDADVHSERCYRYYLEQVDGEDVAVLLRLANMLVREGEAGKALEVYDKIIALDSSMESAWFNRCRALTVSFPSHPFH